MHVIFNQLMVKFLTDFTKLSNLDDKIQEYIFYQLYGYLNFINNQKLNLFNR